MTDIIIFGGAIMWMSFRYYQTGTIKRITKRIKEI